MSIQALLVIIIYTLCLIITFITSIIQKKVNVGVVLGFIFSFLYIGLLAYDTNCLTDGQCNTWSWIRTVLYLIFPTIVMIFLMINMFKKEKPDESKKIESSVVSVTTPVVTTTTPVVTTTTKPPTTTTTSVATPVATTTTKKEGFFQSEYEEINY